MKVKFRRFLSYLISLVLVTPMFLWGSGLAMANGINISVTGDSGGVFKIGDTVDVIVTSAAGQTTQVDFTGFGGSTVIAQESASTPGQYEADFQIVPGSIDSAAFVWARVDGADWTKDNESFFVDNIAPLTVGQGLLAINKKNSGSSSMLAIGDTLTFTKGSLDDSDGEEWTVNLATPYNVTGDSALKTGLESAGALENGLTGDFSFVVTGTDNAGNVSEISQGTNLVSVDTKRPTLEKAEAVDVNTIKATFSEDIDGATVSEGDFAISSGQVITSAVRISAGIVEISLADSLDEDIDPNSTKLELNASTCTKITDIAGNEIAVPGSVGINDKIAPEAPQITDPLLPIFINADAVMISGISAPNSIIKIYTDPNSDGNRDDGIIAKEGTADQSGEFSLSVNLAQNQENYFWVTASDAAGNESKATDVPTIIEDSSVVTPKHFSVNQNGDYVDLSWSASDDAIGYEIWRSSSPYKMIAVVDKSTLSYSDKTVARGVKYYYKVVAVDALGNRSESAELSIELPASATAPVSSASVPIVTAALSQTVQSIEVPVEMVDSAISAGVVSVTTPTPESSATPEVKGAQEEQEGESWWTLVIPVALVLLAGAILPLTATSAISVPIIGAILALIVSAYTTGDLKSSYMYLILGGEVVVLLIVNYGLLSGGVEGVTTQVSIKDEQSDANNSKKRRKRAKKKK